MKAAAVFTFFLFLSASGICFTGKHGKELPKRQLQLIFTHMIGKEPLVLGNACTNISLRITETPVCHDPGALAMKIADNYSTMFSLNSVH